MVCPSCNNSITWRQRQKFLTILFTRRVANCPHCGASLIYAKRAHRFVIAGIGLNCISMLEKTATGSTDSSNVIIILLGLVLIVYGISKLRFIFAGQSEDIQEI